MTIILWGLLLALGVGLALNAAARIGAHGDSSDGPSPFLVGLPTTLALFAGALGLPPSRSALSAPALVNVLAVTALMVSASRRIGHADTPNRFAIVALTLASLAIGVPLAWTFGQAQLAFRGMPLAQPVLSRDVCPLDKRPLVAHISDTHITSAKETFEGVAVDLATVRRTIDALGAMAPRYVVLSGDTTDSGNQKDWGVAESLLSSMGESRVILAPGNHDLSTAYEGHPSAYCRAAYPLAGELKSALGLGDRDERGVSHRLVHQQNFLRTQARLFPMIRTAEGRLLSEQVSSVEASIPRETDLEQAESLRSSVEGTCESLRGPDGVRGVLAQSSCYANAVSERRGQLETVAEYVNSLRKWVFAEAVYPLNFVDPDHRIGFLVFASSLASSDLTFNSALGFVPSPQVRAAREIVKGWPSEIDRIVVVLHHPPARNADDKMAFPDSLTRAAVAASPMWNYAFLRNDYQNSSALLRSLSEVRSGAKIHVAFDHRHRRRYGEVGALTLSESPSSLVDPGYFWIGASDARPTWCPL